jgi:hypothetical protein
VAVATVLSLGCTSVASSSASGSAPSRILRAALADTTDSLTRVYTALQVEKHTIHRAHNELPRGGWGAEDGRAVARYVVDQQGRVEANTIELDSSDSAELGRRLLTVLPRWRYYAAERHGRPVRQLTEVEVIKRGMGVQVSLATDVAGRHTLAAP